MAKEVAAVLSSYSENERAIERKAFDDTKAGVKGLFDAKITKMPRFFYHQPDKIKYSVNPDESHIRIPVIDLGDLANDDPVQRNDIVEKIREASETWGFFQIVNHEIPISVLDEMKKGLRRFYEQDNEVKSRYYTRDQAKPVVYNCNFDLFTGPAANWRDTFLCHMAPNPPKVEDLPEACRYYNLL